MYRVPLIMKLRFAVFPLQWVSLEVWTCTHIHCLKIVFLKDRGYAF